MSAAHAYLSVIDHRLHQLAEREHDLRRNAVHMAAFLTLTDPAQRDRAVELCIAAGLLTTPRQTFTTAVQLIIAEVSHAL
jgi:hypothetical protein